MKHAVAMALVGTLALATEAAAGTTEVERLVAALLGSTPMEEDLRVLTDEIGGRATGSETNRRSVEWALERFRNAGVDARAEAFTMPELWLERSTRISIEGDVTFRARAVAMPFTPPTPPEGHVAPLLDGGTGSAVDFARLGSRVRGAFVLVETRELTNLEGLFREYADAHAIDTRALAGEAAGVVVMASRPGDVL